MDRLASTLPGFLTPLDIAALAVFLIGPLILTRLIEHPGAGRPSTAALMADYRRKWMEQAPKRENRMVDAALITSLRNGAAFFASGCVIAIGGIFAAIGQAERIVDVAGDISTEIEPRAEVWEMKLLFLLVLTVSAFLRFVWAHRLFGYCAVLVGAMPEGGAAEETARAVRRAASINISGARSFNRGLRGIYFAIAALAWLLGPIALVIAALITTAMIYRREFLSESRAALMQERGR